LDHQTKFCSLPTNRAALFGYSWFAFVRLNKYKNYMIYIIYIIYWGRFMNMDKCQNAWEGLKCKYTQKQQKWMWRWNGLNDGKTNEDYRVQVQGNGNGIPKPINQGQKVPSCPQQFRSERSCIELLANFLSCQATKLKVKLSARSWD
jgi:hypothetical protein